MKRGFQFGLLFAAIAMMLVAQIAPAATMSLEELGFKSSADGIVYDTPYGTWVPPTADLSGFSLGTGLGSIKFTFSGVGSHYVAGFFDYQFVDAAVSNGIDDEYGVVNGAPSAGQSWEIGDSFGSFIYSDFSAFNSTTPLLNTNGLPSGAPGDMALALGYAFTIGVGDPSVDVIFTSSLTAPSGFSLQQVDPKSGDSVYVFFGPAGPTGPVVPGAIPEPSTILLIGSGLALVSLARFRKRG